MGKNVVKALQKIMGTICMLLQNVIEVFCLEQNEADIEQIHAIAESMEEDEVGRSFVEVIYEALSGLLDRNELDHKISPDGDMEMMCGLIMRMVNAQTDDKLLPIIHKFYEATIMLNPELYERRKEISRILVDYAIGFDDFYRSQPVLDFLDNLHKEDSYTEAMLSLAEELCLTIEEFWEDTEEKDEAQYKRNKERLEVLPSRLALYLGDDQIVEQVEEMRKEVYARYNLEPEKGSYAYYKNIGRYDYCDFI